MSRFRHYGTDADDNRVTLRAGPAKVELLRSTTQELTDHHGYDVSVRSELQDGRMVVTELIIRQRPGGPGVTSEGIRRLAVQQMVRHSLLVAGDVDDEPVHRVSFGLLRTQDRDRMRAEGPTEETLQWVSLIYQAALAVGDPPTKAVYETFAVSPRTAGLWVAKARAAGYLSDQTGADNA